ncbi:MAG TPA: glycine cleavage system protein GcvH [Thermoplasmata archaeon]|nr:glycine cleavage system protein GcvH [Thermoplasmata archaeon]
MSDPTVVPEELRYTAEHEWFRVDGAEVTVGVTDHAQHELTDVVFVDLPAVGKTVAAHGPVLTLESVKTVSDVYAPVAGTVTAVNEQLKGHPELVNQDPYGKGWLFQLRPAAPVGPTDGLSAPEYRAHIAAPP